MVLTEAEARTKWCPFAYPNQSRGKGDRTSWTLDHINRSANCIASECMAWRWTRAFGTKPREKWDGYCGLTEPRLADVQVERGDDG